MEIATFQTRYQKQNGSRVIGLVKESSKDLPGTGEINGADDAAQVFESVFDASNRPEEHFWMLALGGANNILGAFEVSIGTATASLVHQREVFIRAILAGAVSIIVAHNHPAGDLKESPQDLRVTKTIREAGELIGIRLYDHLILAGGKFASAM